jgi:hypothetical protein
VGPAGGVEQETTAVKRVPGIPHPDQTAPAVEGRRRRPGRVAAATAAVVALVVPGLASPSGTAPAAGAPAAAATTSLTRVRVIADAYPAYHIENFDNPFSTPAVADLWRDGTFQVVTGGMDGCVRVRPVTGSRRIGCIHTGAGPVQASPLLVDWDRDGGLDIVSVNMRTGRISVFDPRRGRELWAVVPPGALHRVFATPAVGDVTGDGRLDLAVTGVDSHVYVWDHSGRLIVHRFLYDSLFSSPAIVDLDGDGRLDLVFGGDMDIGNPAPWPWGGLVWAVRGHDGVDLPGWPVSVPGQVVWSSPSIADLDGDGRPDVVVGTGNNFNQAPIRGKAVYAFDHRGRPLPGWPVAIGGRSMGSPALGDVTGDGRPDAAVQADDGRVYAIGSDGVVLWSHCNMSFTPCTGAPLPGVNGSPSLADLDADGRLEVISVMERTLRVFDGRTGVVETEISLTFDCLDGRGSWPPQAAPTVVEIGGRAHVAVQVLDDANTGNVRGPGDRQVVCVYRSSTALGPGGWPTFKQNARRTGTVIDEAPPTAALESLAAGQRTTRIRVSWSAVDAGSGVATFDVDAKVGAAPRTAWKRRAAPAARVGAGATGAGLLYVPRGRSVAVWVRAWDRAGNASPWAGPVRTYVPPTATRLQPFTAAYALAASGQLGPVSSPPAAGPGLGDLARDLALAPRGGGWVLDAWGGIHPFGGAPRLAAPAYWPGRDRARSLAVHGDGRSGYVLDDRGTLHPFGGAARVATPLLPPGTALRVVLFRWSRPDRPAGYVLDVFGKLVRFGAAPAVRDGPSWTWPVARDVALDPEGRGGYVLDAHGGIHPFGGAPRLEASVTWPGRDLARALVLIADGDPRRPQGYVVDAHGRFHPAGGAPTGHLVHQRRWPAPVGQAAAVLP